MLFIENSELSSDNFEFYCFAKSLTKLNLLLLIHNNFSSSDDPSCTNCNQRLTKEIPCSTHRCPLGKCLDQSQLCNKIADCHDASDEKPETCEKFAKNVTCLIHEFECRNEKCIDKSKFCNHIDECGDKSDEPSECTCFDYLKITRPNKLCDGIIHCWDRTDEDAVFCKDTCGDKSKFMCQG